MEAVALQALVTILKIQHSPPTASVSLMSQLELEMYFAGINETKLEMSFIATENAAVFQVWILI